MKRQLQIQQVEQEDEVTFVTDTVRDTSLQQDYIAFSRARSEDSSSSGLEELEATMQVFDTAGLVTGRLY